MIKIAKEIILVTPYIQDDINFRVSTEPCNPVNCVPAASRPCIPDCSPQPNTCVPDCSPGFGVCEPIQKNMPDPKCFPRPF